jgi:FkbM family methyltransferase
MLKILFTSPIYFIRRCCTKLNFYLLTLSYLKFKKNHIFNINIDDLNFKMSFADYKLSGSIVERIQGIREPETTSIIRSTVKEGAKVLEIGGCYGYFTTIMSKCTRENGEVVSLEGLPNNYKILTENIQLNSLNNVKCYNYFISSTEKFIYFNRKAKDPYKDIKNMQNNKMDDKQEKVECIKLNEFLKQINFEPTHIFMDIEGFEVDALEHLFNSDFLNNKPQIVFEIHKRFYKNKNVYPELVKKLSEKGYKIREIAGNCLAY